MMVGKWSCRNPLTIEERRKIMYGLDYGMNYREIAEYVGRCKSVVIRESKRLGCVSKYNSEFAQIDFEDKQRAKRK